MASPITLLNTTTDYAHFKYAVQSKIYPQLSSTAIVTARGDCGGGANCSAVAPGRRSAGSAVSALTLTEVSPFARIVDAWTTEEFALEGQDMCEGGNLLITADLLHGHLLSFNASCLRCGPLSVLKLSTNSALHVRLYSPGGGAATRVGAFDRSDLPAACAAHRRGGRLYALVSTGLASQQRSRGRVPSDPPGRPLPPPAAGATGPDRTTHTTTTLTTIRGGLLAVEIEAEKRRLLREHAVEFR